MDRLSRQTVNKETSDFSDALDQVDLIGVYRIFHPKMAEYTFFSSSHGPFSRVDHILVHKYQ